MGAPLEFNDPSTAGPEGIVAVGGDLNLENLTRAYSNGIFPWPHAGFPMLWFSPDPRGIIDFSELKLSKSFEKWRKKNQHLKITINEAFPEVIKCCRTAVRKGQEGTWITKNVVQAYLKFHEAQHVMSLEIWEEFALVGGIYGVRMKNYFSAESMFHKTDNASKLALVKLIEFLRSEGLDWMDIQMVTPLTAQFGGKYIPREEFLKRINPS